MSLLLRHGIILRTHLKECSTPRKFNLIRHRLVQLKQANQRVYPQLCFLSYGAYRINLQKERLIRIPNYVGIMLIMPFLGKFTTNDRMLRYKRIQITFYSDKIFGLTHKSVRQFKCCQAFVSNKGFFAVYTMQSQKELQNALHCFFKQVGVPVILIVDGHLS